MTAARMARSPARVAMHCKSLPAYRDRYQESQSDGSPCFHFHEAASSLLNLP